MQEHSELTEIQGQVSRLANQIEQIQWAVARLLQENQASNSQLTTLTKHLINADAQTRFDQKLAELLAQLATGQEKIDELTETVKKLSRTQFKTNALSETKDQHIAETVALLRDLAAKREELNDAQKLAEQQRVAELQTNARRAVAADFLPVLDGIEMALEHHMPLPAKAPQPEKPAPAPGFFGKLFRSSVDPQQAQPGEEAPKVEPQLYDTITAWLRGLEIVRDRCLHLLKREGIERIPDLNEQFDPHRHVAIDTQERPDVPANTIVGVTRKGYLHKERVLRYAEVIVAKPPQADEKTKEEELNHRDTEDTEGNYRDLG